MWQGPTFPWSKKVISELEKVLSPQPHSTTAWGSFPSIKGPRASSPALPYPFTHSLFPPPPAFPLSFLFASWIINHWKQNL